MGWLNRMNEAVKRGVRQWLQASAAPYNISIMEMEDFETAAIKNQIWYRGDSNELTQLYQQNADFADRFKFWACACSPGQEMRKLHTGLPALMVNTLTAIVKADMLDFEFENPGEELIWGEITKKDDIPGDIGEAITDTLVIGDGAFKVSIDTDLSPYPILEWFPGNRVEFTAKRKILTEVTFKSPYRIRGAEYTLHEIYGYGYVRTKLYKGDSEIPLNALEEFRDIQPEYLFDSNVMLAVPLSFRKSAKYDGRGGSIFDGKLDSFDGLDEIWSQWMDASRQGRAHTYINSDAIPKNPTSGEILRPNPFDNRFIEIRGSFSESNNQDPVRVVQSAIPHESFAAAFSTALDLCLQGIISPSTLGIDVKKLDNADAQREKEKATLYTRNAIILALQKTLPKVIKAMINAYQLLNNISPTDVGVSVPFGEYANPSFESQVETVGKAKTNGIMSTEACVEELYGDTRDDDWKAEEVARIKAEQGIEELEEPALNTELGDFAVNLEG